MNYIRIIPIFCFIFCLLVMTSQGVIAWGSLRSNSVPGLQTIIAPSHDYINQEAYKNLETDPAFNKLNFPPFDLVNKSEGQDAELLFNTILVINGKSPDIMTNYSKHEYNPITNKGGAPSEASIQYSSLKRDLNFNDKETAALNVAWLAHYVADMSCPYHVNGMPPDDVPMLNQLVLPKEAIGYPLPKTDKGMGRIENSLGQKIQQGYQFNPNAKLISGIPADAPLRGRGWHDNDTMNWTYEYSHFNDLRRGKVDTYDWFDPWYTDGTYNYTYSYTYNSPTFTNPFKFTPKTITNSQVLYEASSTHSLWEWYAFRNYSRPQSKVGYSPIFIEIQKRNGNGADSNIEEFAKEIATNTKNNQTGILDESTSGQDNLPIDSKLGQAYQEAIRDVYTVWRASFSALRPTVSVMPSSGGKANSRDVIINIENKASEPVQNVHITASTNSTDWSISPDTYDVNEIPAEGSISLDNFQVFNLTETTSTSDLVLINITVTGTYKNTPDSGFANNTTIFDPKIPETAPEAAGQRGELVLDHFDVIAIKYWNEGEGGTYTIFNKTNIPPDQTHFEAENDTSWATGYLNQKLIADLDMPKQIQISDGKYSFKGGVKASASWDSSGFGLPRRAELNINGENKGAEEGIENRQVTLTNQSEITSSGEFSYSDKEITENIDVVCITNVESWINPGIEIDVQATYKLKEEGQSNA